MIMVYFWSRLEKETNFPVLMNFETIEELEGKFEYLKKHKEGPKKLDSLSDDYIKYLGASRSLGQAIRNLALDNKITTPVIKRLFGSFVVPQMLNPLKKIEYPPFWDDTVEEKFHLQSDFQVFLNNLNEQIRQQTTNESRTKKGTKSQLKWSAEAYSPVDFKTIEELHKNLLGETSKEKSEFEIKHVEFKEREATLKINKQIEVSILTLRKGTSLCRIMFNQAKRNEPIEWSVIYEEITGLELDFNPRKSPPEQRVVRDAMYSVNNRIKEVTGSKTGIFLWEEKSVIRLY